MSFNPQSYPHLDHGYAVTRYSGQGQTVDRVLIHVDTEVRAKELVNKCMALMPFHEANEMRKYSRIIAAL
jgi:ATP-dependent exoDNAse (exonuclease V) alpha subunit